jgi:hypothetical protein
MSFCTAKPLISISQTNSISVGLSCLARIIGHYSLSILSKFDLSDPAWIVTIVLLTSRAKHHSGNARADVGTPGLRLGLSH